MQIIKRGRLSIEAMLVTIVFTLYRKILHVNACGAYMSGKHNEHMQNLIGPEGPGMPTPKITRSFGADCVFNASAQGEI